MVDVKQRWHQSTPGCCLLSSFDMALVGLNRRLYVSEGALSWPTPSKNLKEQPGLIIHRWGNQLYRALHVSGWGDPRDSNWPTCSLSLKGCRIEVGDWMSGWCVCPVFVRRFVGGWPPHWCIGSHFNWHVCSDGPHPTAGRASHVPFSAFLNKETINKASKK